MWSVFLNHSLGLFELSGKYAASGAKIKSQDTK
jgi:hypothetical protein